MPRLKEPIEYFINGLAVDTGITYTLTPYGIFASLIRKLPCPLYPVEKLLFLFLHLGKQLLFQLLDFIDDTFRSLIKRLSIFRERN